MASERQIEANRRNALKSTGPKTEAGREESRKNALKHGLSGAGVVLPDEEAEAIRDRLAKWAPATPSGDYRRDWLVKRVVIESVRIDRCTQHEMMVREVLSRRAGTALWDDDRRLAAVILGDRLAKRPDRVAKQLRQTSQGCDWLLQRWEALGSALMNEGGWDGARRSTALDLLGVPHDLRDGPTPLDPEPGAPERKALADLVIAEMDELQALKDESLDDLDGFEQGAAQIGLGVDVALPLARLRRYESDCMKRFHWAVEQLNLMDGPSQVADASAPAPVSEPEPRVETTPDAPPARIEPSPTPSPSPSASLFPRPKTTTVPIRIVPAGNLASMLADAPNRGNRRARRARRKLAPCPS